jgi:RNA polymerase sigma-70 factor (ECF subfamily)
MADLHHLLDTHGDAIYGFLLQITGSEADASDVFQELWRKLVERPALLDDARDPRGFLLRMARNQFIDLTRRRQTRERIHAEASSGIPLFDTSPDPDEQAFRDALQTALAQLPADQRAVLHLKLWEGLTFDAIATLLDIPPNTAASRYRYGLDKIRDHLRPLYNEIQSP